MKILFLTGRETSYPRNALMLKILRTIGNVEVISETNHKENILLRSVKIIVNLLMCHKIRSYDLIYIGFYGNLLLLFLPKKNIPPILFDAFVSTYDTIIEDRKLLPESSPLAGLAHWVDRIVLRYAKIILVDTYENKKFYIQNNSGFPAQINRIFATCDPEIFFPRPEISTLNNLVLFYGTFLPLHGVEVIIEAARLLQIKTDIRFKLIGEGKKLNRFKKLVVEKKIKNVEFHPFVPINYLPGEIAKATICLCGPFGKSKKASRVITGKTFQCLAMAKPIIVGDTNANRELLRPNLDAIFCKLNSPEDLAKAIEILIGDSNLRQRISMNGFSTFNNKANIATIQKQMITIINSMNI